MSEATEQNTGVPLSNIQQMGDLINQLQESLRANIPNYESLLAVIHKAMQQDEELSHILTDDQIGIVCTGLRKKTGVVIATTSPKKTGAGGKSLKDTTLDDI